MNMHHIAAFLVSFNILFYYLFILFNFLLIIHMYSRCCPHLKQFFRFYKYSYSKAISFFYHMCPLGLYDWLQSC